MPRALAMFLLSNAIASAAAAQPLPAIAGSNMADALKSVATGKLEAVCKNTDPTEVLVCGKPAQPYRIDPAVLESQRAVEAPPPKPMLTDGAPGYDCVGPQHCGGGTLPLVAVALTAVKAAALAANGDDWRDAFRTHPDGYQAYEDAKAKRPKVHIGFGVGVAK